MLRDFAVLAEEVGLYITDCVRGGAQSRKWWLLRGEPVPTGDRVASRLRSLGPIRTSLLI